MEVRLEKGDMLYLPALWCVAFLSFPSFLFFSRCLSLSLLALSRFVPDASSTAPRYHHVTQSTGPGPSSQDQKLMISVNWWYNVRFEGSFWTTMQYMRSQVLALDGREDPPDDDGESSEEEE